VPGEHDGQGKGPDVTTGQSLLSLRVLVDTHTVEAFISGHSSLGVSLTARLPVAADADESYGASVGAVVTSAGGLPGGNLVQLQDVSVFELAADVPSGGV